MKREWLNKAFCLFACLMLLLALLPGGASAADVVASGECGADGDNLTWTLDSDGVLTISGTGAMLDFGYSGDQPWSYYSNTSYYNGNTWVDGGNNIITVNLSAGVTSIGGWAFSGCSKVTSVMIPDSVTSIGDHAFEACSSLTSVTIPDSVTSIGDHAFAFCSGLTGVTIPDSVTSIEDHAFLSCYGLTSVTIPDSVTSIGDNAFAYCSSLTGITIPDSVTVIGGWAFDGCLSLMSITIPNGVTKIDYETFADCSSLVSVTIPNSVTQIRSYAFRNCSSLTNVTIPNGVTMIESVAFINCSNLTSVTIPNSVTLLNPDVFDGCENLTDVYYGGSEADWAAITDWMNDPAWMDDPLLSATIHYNSNGAGAPAAPAAVEDAPPTATQYVPYQEAIPASLSGGSFTLTSGSLPAGLSLSADGVLSGFPEELGVFSFTVTETAGDSSVEHVCSLSTYSRMYANVEESNPPGYGFVETEGDDGRVQDQTVSSVDELTDQVMHCQGPFPQFRNLYLDGRRLVRDVEYRAEEGSTKITIYAETIGEEGGGTHTIAAEFETDDGETVYTVQNYTVYGIASTDVHVEVTGEAVIWTDAEPYIDTNSRTMTPFRVVGDALGLTIAWDSAAREASFSDGTRTIWFPIGSTAARTSEGTTVEMDTSAVIVNGRTYAPVRYLAQYFGYSVGWDAPTRTVKIG